MLNSYDSYLPNVTLDQTSAYLSALSPQNSLLLFGNGGNSGINGAGTPAFPNGNYIYVSWPGPAVSHPGSFCLDAV